MTATHTIVRSLLIYCLCIPLAIYLGYSLATPDDYDTVRLVVLILFVLTIPLFLRHHHFLLVLFWNMPAVVPLLGGSPPIWIAMAATSLGFSVFRRTLNRQMHFLSARSVALPLIFLGIVVLVTAHFTGGISFRTSGSEIYGGKRYFYVLGAIIGFFSFIAQRPALTQVRWYLPVFLLSGITATLSNISPMIGPPWNLVSLFFPADPISQQMFSNNVTAGAFMDIIRFGPLAVAAQSLFLFLLAHYGVKQLFVLRHWWRLLLLLCSFAVGLLGGFRSYMIFMVLTFGVLFWIEGLWRTRLFPALVLAILLGGALIVPFADKLPMSIQRSLSVLPIKIDPIAQLDAEGSTEWRLQMWKILLPEVSQHLILGKGYSIKSQDLELAQTAVVMHGGDTADVALLAGDYHNGPLSVILPFGIFGSVGFLWLIAAGLRVVLKNYSNGDPEFKRTNTFLLAYYIAKTLFFFTVFGSFYSDLFQFTGLIGLSISLNGGICGKAAEPQPKFTYARFPLARASH